MSRPMFEESSVHEIKDNEIQKQAKAHFLKLKIGFNVIKIRWFILSKD